MVNSSGTAASILRFLFGHSAPLRWVVRLAVRFHESQESCSLLEMGTLSHCPSGLGASSSFLVRLRHGFSFEVADARWRSTDMCPCGAASTTVRLVKIHMQSCASLFFYARTLILQIRSPRRERRYASHSASRG